MKSNIYTDNELDELTKMISAGIQCGKTWTKIMKEAQAYHPVDGRHLTESLEILRGIYNSEIERFKGVVKVDMEAVLERSLSRYEELYDIALETKDHKLAKAILDSLVKLTSVDKIKSMSEKMDASNTEFHLDFNL